MAIMLLKLNPKNIWKRQNVRRTESQCRSVESIARSLANTGSNGTKAHLHSINALTFSNICHFMFLSLYSICSCGGLTRKMVREVEEQMCDVALSAKTTPSTIAHTLFTTFAITDIVRVFIHSPLLDKAHTRRNNVHHATYLIGFVLCVLIFVLWHVTRRIMKRCAWSHPHAKHGAWQEISSHDFMRLFLMAIDLWTQLQGVKKCVKSRLSVRIEWERLFWELETSTLHCFPRSYWSI